MTVYVDDVRLPYRTMVMCHMWADTDDELLAMADKIGVRWKWIQGHPTLSLPEYRHASWVHFDISLGKKDLAIAAGAVLTDRYGPVEFLAKRDGNEGVLESISRLRDRRGNTSPASAHPESASTAGPEGASVNPRSARNPQVLS